MRRRAVVTGVGAVTPLGVGADALHKRAVDGHSGIVDGLGRCLDFTPSSLLARRDVRRTDRFSQLALVAADEALAQAGWPAYPADRVGCVIGNALGGLSSVEDAASALGTHGGSHVSALLPALSMPNAAAAAIAMRYGFRGESYGLGAACAAGAAAIGAGLRMLRAGEVDAVVVGGAEAAAIELVRSSFLNASALSASGDSVPFSVDRDGFLLGEGAGVLVLEDAEAAEARGASVLGEVVGYGATSDGFHLTAPEPSGVTAAAAVSRAMADAGAAAADVVYVNAHGTGTRLNDEAEVRALRLALGAPMSNIPLSSTKSSVGHLLGAAGAVEAIATLLALRAGIAPPTVGLRVPDPELGPLAHVLSACPLPPGLGLSTSFGFGGHNAALVLRGV
ncbi:beta-ketoacyl-[acyl-carrier-protein] synthase family protein [Actinokineospora sp. 24-640]